jgi:hypothetical protein
VVLHHYVQRFLHLREVERAVGMQHAHLIRQQPAAAEVAEAEFVAAHLKVTLDVLAQQERRVGDRAAERPGGLEAVAGRLKIQMKLGHRADDPPAVEAAAVDPTARRVRATTGGRSGWQAGSEAQRRPGSI